MDLSSASTCVEMTDMSALMLEMLTANVETTTEANTRTLDENFMMTDTEPEVVTR